MHILSDQTLMGMTKKELVEYIRTKENNEAAAMEKLNQQAENMKGWEKARPGKWTKVGPYISIGGEYKKALICSECNSTFVSDGNKPWTLHNYCPNCGARMDGDKEDV